MDFMRIRKIVGKRRFRVAGKDARLTFAGFYASFPPFESQPVTNAG
jgi:hypothetical protein